jgi:hypothetical protein
MKSAPFNLPINYNSPYRPRNTKRVGYHEGRVAFRISDGIHSIGECLAKTGMEEKAFRKLYSKLNSRKAPVTWEAFDGKA